MAKRTASARKQMRATVGRTLRNKSVRSAVKTRVVRVRRAIAEHAEGVADLGIVAISSLDRAANKGILHANNAARRKSRLMKALNAAEKAPADAVAKPARAKAATTKPAAKPAATKAKAPSRPAAKASAKPAAKAKSAKPAAKKR
ncbi:MAG: 30S ribosomal protein S20 [Candidatus Dormibacteraeota bacterium]|nr:30S ribosomal protein S20 [Candidatus Dormibacteraeota bacterium]